ARPSALPSRLGSTSSGWTTDAIAAILGRCVQKAELERLGGIADSHPARLQDLAVDAERELVPGVEAAVLVQDPERVEIRDAGLRVLRRDRAASDRAAEAHQCLADAHAAPEPCILPVRVDSVDLEQHSEAAAVNGLVLSALTRELAERRLGDQRHVPATAVDGL